jgi:hypothetical protein
MVENKRKKYHDKDKYYRCTCGNVVLCVCVHAPQGGEISCLADVQCIPVHFVAAYKLLVCIKSAHTDTIALLIIHSGQGTGFAIARRL